MPDQRDTVIVEQAKIQRMRLGAALLYGHIDERRTVNDHMKRLFGSIVVAAIACAVCAGISFVSQLLADQAAARENANAAAVSIVVPLTSEAP